MNDKPFFSIVIANYNHGHFLEKAIRSVLNQSCQDFEIIMVDGGSTDNSPDVIAKYSERFSWWVSEKDNGQSDAFNRGFQRAKGKVFFWLNADDLLLPDSLLLAKNHFDAHPDCQWLAGNTVVMDESGKFLWCIRAPDYVDFLVKKGTVYVYGPSSFFHGELFRRCGGFDESLHYTMDTDLWYRFVNLGVRFHRLNHYCWALRVHSNSKTSHAFDSLPSPEFGAERVLIQEKNDHTDHQYAHYLLVLWKLVSGTYLKRWIDSRDMKDKRFD